MFYIAINCASKDESIKRNILEHNINDFMNYAIDKFKMPVKCFIYNHEMPSGKTREIMRVEAETEDSLLFYFGAIVDYFSYAFVDFINLYLEECCGVLEVVVYENGNKSEGNIVHITTDRLNEYIGKNIFKD